MIKRRESDSSVINPSSRFSLSRCWIYWFHGVPCYDIVRPGFFMIDFRPMFLLFSWKHSDTVKSKKLLAGKSVKFTKQLRIPGNIWSCACLEHRVVHFRESSEFWISRIERENLLRLLSEFLILGILECTDISKNSIQGRKEKKKKIDGNYRFRGGKFQNLQFFEHSQTES